MELLGKSTWTHWLVVVKSVADLHGVLPHIIDDSPNFCVSKSIPSSILSTCCGSVVYASGVGCLYGMVALRFHYDAHIDISPFKRGSCGHPVTIYSFSLPKRLLSYLIFGAYHILSLGSATPWSLHITIQSYSVAVYFVCHFLTQCTYY